MALSPAEALVWRSASARGVPLFCDSVCKRKSRYTSLSHVPMRSPVQIRGFLSRWEQICLASPAFDQCTACSNRVVSAYRADPRRLLLGAFNKGSYLEDLTGLTELHSAAEAAAAAWEAEEGDGEGDEGAVDDF